MRTGLYVLVPAMGALIPLLAVPVVTGTFGATAFAALAIGQSVGAAAAVVVDLGWSLNGPQAVARSGPGARRRLLW